MSAWYAARPYLIGAGLVSGFLIVSEMDFRVQVAKEAEQLATMSKVCAKKMQTLVRDENGNYLCAPALVLSMPVGK